MSDIKPKVFWIIDSSQLNGQPTRVYNTEPKWLIGAVEWTKAIEYSAYQQAIDKIDNLENVNSGLEITREALEDKIKELDAEIEAIKNSDVLNTKSLRDLYETKISLLEQDLESEKRSHQITKDSSNEYITEFHNDLKKLREEINEYKEIIRTNNKALF